MLIKRTERDKRRGQLAAQLSNHSAGGIDRRTFLRRSGLVAGGLAAVGAVPLTSMRKANAAAATAGQPGAAPITIRKNICTHCSVGCTVIGEVQNGVWVGQEPGWDSPISRGSHCAKGASTRELVHGDRRLKYPLKLVDGKWTADLLGNRDQRDRRQGRGHPHQVRARIRSTGSARRNSPTKVRICSASLRPSWEPTTSITRRVSAIRRPSRAWPIPGATAR